MTGALLTQPALSSPAGAQVPTRRGEPVVESVRIASYNAGSMVGVKGTVKDVQALIDQGVDIIALQEMSSWTKRVKIREKYLDCETCLYDGYVPVQAVPGGQPILYRSDRFTLLDSGMSQLTKDTYVGPRGAGPSTIRARWVTWVRLRTVATGRQVYILNNHGVPTVQRGDGQPNMRLKKRVAVYAKHMAGLESFVDSIKTTTGGSIFVVGDLNVNYRTDRVVAPDVFPFHSLGLVGMQASYEKLGLPEHGTHVLPNGYDKRLIDYSYSSQPRFVSPTAQTILTGLHSDHRPLVVDYRYASKACFSHHQDICPGAPAPAE
ncbi:MAG: hypothetical protein U0R80_04750 [Nocardioidaceae bacterium]